MPALSSSGEGSLTPRRFRSRQGCEPRDAHRLVIHSHRVAKSCHPHSPGARRNCAVVLRQWLKHREHRRATATQTGRRGSVRRTRPESVGRTVPPALRHLRRSFRARQSDFQGEVLADAAPGPPGQEHCAGLAGRGPVLAHRAARRRRCCSSARTWARRGCRRRRSPPWTAVGPRPLRRRRGCRASPARTRAPPPRMAALRAELRRPRFPVAEGR